MPEFLRDIKLLRKRFRRTSSSGLVHFQLKNKGQDLRNRRKQPFRDLIADGGAVINSTGKGRSLHNSYIMLSGYFPDFQGASESFRGLAELRAGPGYRLVRGPAHRHERHPAFDHLDGHRVQFSFVPVGCCKRQSAGFFFWGISIALRT